MCGALTSVYKVHNCFQRLHTYDIRVPTSARPESSSRESRRNTFLGAFFSIQKIQRVLNQCRWSLVCGGWFDSIHFKSVSFVGKAVDSCQSEPSLASTCCGTGCRPRSCPGEKTQKRISRTCFGSITIEIKSEMRPKVKWQTHTIGRLPSDLHC